MLDQCLQRVSVDIIKKNVNTLDLFAFVSQNLFTEKYLLNTWREVFVVTLYFT